MGLLETTRFVDRPVRVSIHKALNSSRGVIPCRELSGMTEAEIKKEVQVLWRSTGWRWIGILKRSPSRPCFWPSTRQKCPRRLWSAILRWTWPCLFWTRCVALTATSLATQANGAKLLRSNRDAEKISMKAGVRDPSCALIAMVSTLHWLKIARSGRSRRFNESALENAYPFQKPDSW